MFMGVLNQKLRFEGIVELLDCYNAEGGVTTI